MATPREIVADQINHRETDPVPYKLLFEPDVEERVTQYYGTDSWRDRITTFIAPCMASIMHPEHNRREDVSPGAGRIQDQFGSIWRTDRRPRHLERPALPAPSLDGYQFPTARHLVTPEAKEKARIRLEEHPEVYSYIPFSNGLWEAIWGIRGFENALMDCVGEPDFFAELLDRLTDLYLDLLKNVEDIPADACKIGDDWGDQRGIMMGPRRWRQLFKARYARIIEAIHAQGKTVIIHCCGSVVDIIPDLIEMGVDVLESVQPEARGMNPYELKKNWGDKITFWGGLGSQSTIPFGTPAEIRGEVEKLRRCMSIGGGYILAPAKRILSDTPTENAVAVIESFIGEQGA